MQPRERKIRNAVADGAVNVLAGIIQMNGGHPAFPDDGDARAKRDHIDLYAIIRGAQYAFHVSLAQREGKDLRFSVPTNYENSIIIGVVPVAPTKVDFVELKADLIEKYGSRKGGSIEVTVPASESRLPRIETFAERL
jgi:hypothetical protein